MENIILELRKGEKENIYGGEGRVVYLLNEEGKCIPRYINAEFNLQMQQNSD